MKNSLPIFTVVSLFTAIGTSCVNDRPKETEKPNIIFLFADDLSFSSLNNEKNNLHVPNIEDLSKRGSSFTHAYNMGGWNGAICVASRAMLISGRYLWNAYSFEDHQEDLVDRREMWSQIMQDAGYRTYMTGKWHIKTEPQEIFDTVVHPRPGMPPDGWKNNNYVKLYNSTSDIQQYFSALPLGYNRPLSTNDTTWLPWDKEQGGFWSGGKHWSEVVADDALGFIEQAKNDQQPFFMYLAFNAPHDPRQAPKDFVDLYPVDQVEIPEAYMPEYPFKDVMGCDPSLRDEALAPFPRTEYAVKVHMQEYHAIISHMDQQIGRIIQALKESGQMDNTYIIFSADHGLSVGNHGLLGKQNMYDHSIRVPLIIAGPNVPENKKYSQDVYLQDIMPSTLELAGVEKPDFVDFNSFMPIVREEKADSYYPAIYGCYQQNLQRMIRTDEHKLILYPQGKVIRLFNMKNDPMELKDIAGDPGSEEIISSLFKQLIDLQREMNDTLDLKQIYGEN
jgi:arylsulfatase A-like enzyme